MAPVLMQLTPDEVCLNHFADSFGSPLPVGERSICQRVGATRRPMINSANRVRGRGLTRNLTPSPQPSPFGGAHFCCKQSSNLTSSRFNRTSPSPEIRHAALFGRLDAFLEILGRAQPGLF